MNGTKPSFEEWKSELELRSLWRYFKGIVGLVLTAVLAKGLWNAVIPTITTLPLLTFTQSGALVLLIWLVFRVVGHAVGWAIRSLVYDVLQDIYVDVGGHDDGEQS